MVSRPDGDKAAVAATDIPSAADEAVQLVIVIGQSGSGHSTALDILEDADFTAVDNLPLALVDQLVALAVETQKSRLAIGVDLRTAGFEAETVIRLITNLKSSMQDRFQVVMIEASTQELLRRYKATRRRHPMSDQSDSLEQAIEMDKDSLSAVSHLADVHMDSTGRAPADFRRELLSRLGLSSEDKVQVTAQSFSYKKGLPESADYIFDMRFLDNPHWQFELRAKTGIEKPVQEFVEADPRFAPFMDKLKDMIASTLPTQTGDGRPHLTVAFGCTGGKHRSVVAAEWFARWAKAEGIPVSVFHREIR